MTSMIRHAGKIAISSEFLGSLSAFQLGRLAVTGDHEVGYAPDVDFRYHAVGYPANLYRRLFVRL